MRIRLVGTLIALVGCADVDANNPFDPSAPETVRARGVIEGCVEAVDDGAVEGATVGLQGTATSGATDAEGCFTLTDVPEGVFTLVVELPCYRRLVVPGVLVALGGEVALELPALELETGSVSGRVDVDGGDDGEVSPSQLTVRSTQGIGAAEVGDDWTFTLRGLLACRQVQVVASLPGFKPARSDLVEVVADEQTELSGPLVLERAPGFIAGAVALPPDSEDGLGGIAVSFSRGGEATTDADGAFSLGPVRAGAGTLEVTLPGYATLRQPVLVDPSYAEGGSVRPTDVGVLQLVYAVTSVSGEVLTDDSEAAAGAVVDLADGPTPKRTFVADDGSWRIEGVRAGRYVARAALTGYHPRQVELTVGETPVVAEQIVLPVQPGSLVGTVLAEPDVDDPEWSAAGTVVALDGTELAAQTDAEGAFALENVRAGVYTIRISRPGDGYASRVVPTVSVLPGAATDLGVSRLSFARGGVVGAIRLADGAAPGDAQVLLDGPSPGQLQAGEDGGYAFFDVRVGTYTVTASLEGYRSASTVVDVSRDELAEPPELVLETNPGSIRGRVVVTDPGGSPETARVVVVGTELAAVADAEGVFEIAEVRRGTYSLRVEHGGRYRPRNLPNVLVQAGEPTDLGGIDLDLANGRVVSTVNLSDAEALADELGPALSRVRVDLTSNEGGTSYSALADANGRAEFPSVLVGAYSLQARLDGYLPTDPQQVEVAEDGQLIELEQVLVLPLNPGAIAGVVVLEDPRADRAGIEVALVGSDGQALTDANGEFLIEGLKARNYTLRIDHRAEGYALGNEGPVAVVPGGTTELGEVRIFLARGDFAGAVTTADGESAAGALVELDGPEHAVAFADDDGAWQLTNLRAGRPGALYTVRASLYGYRSESVQAQVAADDVTTIDALTLAVDAGAFIGRVVDLEEAAVAGADVAVGGGVVQTDADGRFDTTQALALRAGDYTVTVRADAFDEAVYLNQPVEPGARTDLGDIRLRHATGDLHGTVALGADGDPSQATVRVEQGDAPVAAVAVDGDGDWSVRGLRVGAYTVVADHPHFLPGETDVRVEKDVDTPVAELRLAPDPGGIEGRVVLGDGDAAEVGTVTVLVEPTGDVLDALVAADGGLVAAPFAAPELLAGVYNLTFERAGYRPETRAGLVVRAGETLVLDDVVLRDEKAPEAPTLALYDGVDPLDGFPAEPVFAQVDETRVVRVTLTADTTPTDDANFDPANGTGHWEWRTNSMPWADVPPGSIGVVAGAVVIRVVLPEPRRDERDAGLYPVHSLKVRAVDAAVNAGDFGELLVKADDADPLAFELGAPVSGCVEDDDATIRTCVFSGEVANLPLRRPSLDLNFGCYYLYEAEWDDPDDLDDAVAALEAVDIAEYDTATCFAEGTQYFSVFPTEGASTVYCLRAVDQSRRFAGFLDDQGRASACMVVLEDSEPPETPDLYPDGVVVRGGSVVLRSDRPGLELDEHFFRFEKRGSTPGAVFTAVGVAEAEQLAFGFGMLRGQDNTVALRAVDRAGNVSAATEVTLSERSVFEVVAGDEGIGASPTISGSRLGWARPLGCDREGVDNICRHAVLLLDEALADPGPTTLRTVQTCSFGCGVTVADAVVVDGAGAEPLLRLTPRGAAYSEYVEGQQNVAASTRLGYTHFGDDRLVGTGDDTTVMLAVDTAVVALEANARQVAFVAFHEAVDGCDADDPQQFALRRAFLDDDGVATGVEHTLPLDAEGTCNSPGNPVTSLALRGHELAYTLADGSAWYWGVDGVGDAEAPVEIGPLPVPPGGGGVRAKAIVAGDRFLGLAVEQDLGAQPRDGTQGFVLKLDLGLPPAFAGDEPLEPLGVECETTRDCDGGDECLEVQAETKRCSARIGHRDLRCQNGLHPEFCRERVYELDLDDNVMTWVAPTVDANSGQPLELVRKRRIDVPQPGSSGLVQRAGRKHSLQMHADKLVYLDEATGAPRVAVGDTTLQYGVAADARPKRSPAMGRDWLLYSSYISGRPAELVATNPVDFAGLRPALPGQPPADAVVLAVLVDVAGDSEGAAVQIPRAPDWTMDRLVRFLNRPAQEGQSAFTVRAQGQRLRVVSVGIGTDVTLQVGANAVLGFPDDVAADGTDTLDPSSGLQLLPLSQNAEEPIPLEADDALQQSRWREGTHYALSDRILLTAAERGAQTRVVAVPLPEPRQCTARAQVEGEPHPCLEDRVVLKEHAAGDLAAVAVDGTTLAWAVTGGGDEGIWVADAAAVVRQEPGELASKLDDDIRCRLVAVQGKLLVCVSWSGGDPLDKNRQFIRFYNRLGAGWNRADRNPVVPGTQDEVIPERTGGLITSIGVSGTHVVFEREEQGLLRVYLASALEPGAELVYGRTGDDLGPGSVFGGAFYFADAGALGQPEILRLRLSDRQIDRITNDDAVQHYPGAGFSGLVYVDHRYVVSGQGRPLVPPALTVRSIP